MKTVAIALVAVGASACALASGRDSPWTHSLQEEISVVAYVDGLDLEADERVRIVRADGRTLDGRFHEVAGGILSIETSEGVLSLPENEIYRIYRVEKRRGQGALRGLLVGLGITAALGLATMTQATEEGEGALGFGIGLAFAVPAGVAVGVIASPDRRELVYENPGFAPPEPRPPPAPEPAPQQPRPPPAELPRAPQIPPEIPNSFYVGASGGASYLGGQPRAGAMTEQPSPSATYTVQGLFRASERWGFGGEVLFTDAGTWTWEQEDRAGTDSRKIVAPGFKVYYFPVVSTNELTLNAGVSAFRQESTQTVNQRSGSIITETKLDPYFNVGLFYHRYVRPNIGIGANLQYYTGGQQIPSPLVLFSASISFRTHPPEPR